MASQQPSCIFPMHSSTYPQHAAQSISMGSVVVPSSMLSSSVSCTSTSSTLALEGLGHAPNPRPRPRPPLPLPLPTVSAPWARWEAFPRGWEEEGEAWQQQLLLRGAPAPAHGASSWVPGECGAKRAAHPLLCVPAWCSPRQKGSSALWARVVPF